MNRTLLSAVSATALSIALALGAPALAQVQLADEVANKLAELGIDQTLIVDEEQVLKIENVLNTNDDRDSQIEQINMILEGTE